MNALAEPVAARAETNHDRSISQFLVDEFVLIDAGKIPDAVLDRTVLCFVDTLGVALAAVGLNVGTGAVAVARKSSVGPCTLWGSDHGASMTDAAFANGMLSHALDFDDTHTAAIMHSSCIVVPTAIAMAQQLGVSPRNMLAAAVVGYEVAGRLGRLAPGPFQDNGFQATAVLGVFASTAVASRLLGLSREQAVNAFGIAGSMAAGIMEYLSNGSDVKQVHAGWSAQSGIRAAQLAAEGVTGPATVFEGRFGVFKSFARLTVDPATALNFKVDTWEVELMGPKPYPACLCVHPLVQAVLDIKARLHESGATIDDLANLHCHVPEWYVNLVFEPREAKMAVATPYEARFSGPYCIARILLDDHLTIASFSADKIHDAQAAKYANLVSYEVEALPEFPEAFPARVIATTTSGAKIESYIRHNLGSPGNPLTTEQYDQKFLQAAGPFLPNGKAESLLAAVKGLRSIDGLQEFSQALHRSTISMI